MRIIAPEGKPTVRYLLITGKTETSLVSTKNAKLIAFIQEGKVAAGNNVRAEFETGEGDDTDLAEEASKLGAKPARLKKIEVVR